MRRKFHTRTFEKCRALQTLSFERTEYDPQTQSVMLEGCFSEAGLEPPTLPAAACEHCESLQTVDISQTDISHRTHWDQDCHIKEIVCLSKSYICQFFESALLETASKGPPCKKSSVGGTPTSVKEAHLRKASCSILRSLCGRLRECRRSRGAPFPHQVNADPTDKRI